MEDKVELKYTFEYVFDAPAKTLWDCSIEFRHTPYLKRVNTLRDSIETPYMPKRDFIEGSKLKLYYSQFFGLFKYQIELVIENVSESSFKYILPNQSFVFLKDAVLSGYQVGTVEPLPHSKSKLTTECFMTLSNLTNIDPDSLKTAVNRKAEKEFIKGCKNLEKALKAKKQKSKTKR